MNRLIAVHTPAEAVGEVLIIAVELWTNAVFVHFARVENEETDRLMAEYEAEIATWRKSEDFPEGFPEQPGTDLGRDLALADDAGTGYRPKSGHAGGAGLEWRGVWRFEPGVPDQASRLTISTCEGAMELEL